MDFVAKAKPMATMAATVRSTVSITPVIQATVPYRLKDFAMIGSYAASAQAIVVKQDAPWKSLEELIADANPTPASAPTGRLARAPTCHGAAQARVAWTSPTSPSAARALKTAILGGHVQIGAISLSTMIPVIKSGDVTCLVISGDKRHPAIPDVPTMAERAWRRRRSAR